MKEFILKEIQLLSLKEGKARKIEFHPKRTVIVGMNSTGKSCLLKSIYQTFGAEPHNLHPSWQGANVISHVYFRVNHNHYSILKNGSLFCLFDSKGEKINQFNRISSLGEYLASIFDFKVKLTDRKGEVVTPPPAYLFMPYYADQDKSWTANWASFSKLYLPNARTDIANYHTGIKPNEYYIAKSELGSVNDSIQMIDREMSVVRSLLKNLKEKLSKIDFTLSVDEFQEQVKELLVACEELNKLQNKLKYDLTNLYNHKINLQAQLEITKKALVETKNDYEYAVNTLDEVVPCPSCGAEYENSFAERFGIAQDEQRCLDLIFELQEELNSLNLKIDYANSEFHSNNKVIADIQKSLEHKKEKIKLRDVIESEGKREMRKLFETEIQEYERQLKEKLLIKNQLEKDIKALDDQKRRARIKDEYMTYMSSFLKELNIYSLSETSYKKIDSSIKESGSAMPRALMAYYYSILHVMRKNGSSAYCPILIDSPNQQGQDRENLPILLKFIINNQPKDSQLILAIEETHDINFSAKMIELHNKRSLLLEDEYDSVFQNMQPFLRQIIID